MKTQLEEKAEQLGMSWTPGDPDPMNWDDETFREHGVETPAGRRLFLREFAHTLESRDLRRRDWSAKESDSEWVRTGKWK